MKQAPNLSILVLSGGVRKFEDYLPSGTSTFIIHHSLINFYERLFILSIHRSWSVLWHLYWEQNNI